MVAQNREKEVGKCEHHDMPISSLLTTAHTLIGMSTVIKHIADEVFMDSRAQRLNAVNYLEVHSDARYTVSAVSVSLPLSVSTLNRRYCLIRESIAYRAISAIPNRTLVWVIVPVRSDKAVAVVHRSCRGVLLPRHEGVSPLRVRDVVVIVHRSEPLVGEDRSDLQHVGGLLSF